VTEVYSVVSGVGYVSNGAPVESGPFVSPMALLVVVMGPFLVLSMVAVHADASADDKPYGLAAGWSTPHPSRAMMCVELPTRFHK
jgi:hypothetical protein